MPPLGETIGPRRAAVSARLVVDVDRILLTVRPRDLLPAVKLMAAVIVQSQHTGQRTARPRRFQEHRLRPRPVRQLPRKFLYLQPVIFVLTFDPALPCPSVSGIATRSRNRWRAAGRQDAGSIQCVCRNERKLGPSPARVAAHEPYAPSIE